MTRNDSICLCRNQHAELYAGNGELRLVVDHPSNSPLLGARACAILVRAAVFTVDACDGSAVVYVGRGGAASRVATAKVMQQESGGGGLTDWQIEAGFDHAATEENGATIHRITRSA